MLVDFWATWCGPCMREVPHLVETYRKYKQYGFEIIGVSIDRPGKEEGVRAVTDRLGMNWRHIYQDSPRIKRENGVKRIPATFLLDRDGNVRYTKLRGEAIERRVHELMKEGGLLVDGGNTATGVR